MNRTTLLQDPTDGEVRRGIEALVLATSSTSEREGHSPFSQSRVLPVSSYNNPEKEPIAALGRMVRMKVRARNWAANAEL
jgi:hypothetical protein